MRVILVSEFEGATQRADPLLIELVSRSCRHLWRVGLWAEICPATSFGLRRAAMRNMIYFVNEVALIESIYPPEEACSLTRTRD